MTVFIENTIRYLKNHWWSFPLIVFLVGRTLSVLYIVNQSSEQPENPISLFDGRVASTPNNYWGSIANSDGFWYQFIAYNGYRQNSIYDAQGVIRQSEWSFYPLWPKFTGLLSDVTLIPAAMVGGVLSLIFALGGVLLLYKLVEKLKGKNYAMIAAVWIALSPLSVIFHMYYTEGLAFFLIVSMLWLVDRKSYLWALLPITLLAFTRPVGVAVGFFFLLFWLMKYKNRFSKPFPGREQLLIAVAFIWGFLSFGLWPFILAVRQHQWDFFFEVQSAFRSHGSNAVLFIWPDGSIHVWMKIVIAVFLLSIITAIFARDRYEVGWPVLIKLWAIAYLAFIVVTIQPIFFLTEIASNGSKTFDPVINHSLWRYGFLCLIPIVPLQWIGRTPRLTQWLLWCFFACVCVFLSFVYIDYFVIERNNLNFTWP